MTAPDYDLASAHDQKLAADASPELQALAEVLRIAVPGLKMPHATMAATIARMLRARGVHLVMAPAMSLPAPATQPAEPACWCRRCEREAPAGDHGSFGRPMRFVVCPTCGNKRCPRATDHRLDCSGSNAPGQAGSDYA